MIGTTVSHYRVVEKIGEGGMGEVYLAEDASLRRNVALKFLPEHLQEDVVARKRFLREAESAAALEHPYICNIKEVNQTDDGLHFIVMEFVAGQTLKEKLHEEGALSTLEAIRICAEVADALEMAHGKNIVHRDLKPANIMLTPQGHVKVMDFGLAKRVVSDDGREQDLTSGITREGSTLGTPAYMSPEQVRAETVDSRSDLFSVGIVLYEMLTGRHPFLRSSSVETMGAILLEEPEPLSRHLPDSAGMLQATVSQLLTKDADQRLQTIEDLSALLTELESGAGELRLKAFLRSRLGRRLALGSVAVVVAILGGTEFFSSEGPSTRGAMFSSLAVLPLTNSSGDPEQEFLVDGVTEELTVSLSMIGSLTVTAQSAAMRFRELDLPLSEVARELGVDVLVGGTVQRDGDIVRVTAQLIDPATESNLWAGRFEEDLSSVMAMYGEVARTIAGEGRVRLTPEEESLLTDVQEVNREAYLAYLEGTFHWKRVTPEDIDLAEQYFEMALEEDSTFAPAQAGLAILWGVRSQLGLAPPLEALTEGRAAALRAIELDDASSEAHEALALIMSWVEWDWAGAWPHWERALEINPNAGNANAYYGAFLCIMGRPDEALPYAQRALEVDRLNPLYHALNAGVLLHNRRFDDVMVALEEAEALMPGNPVLEGLDQFVYMGKGMRDEQLAHQRERIAGDAERVSAFERGLEEGGYTGAQLAIADLLADRYEEGRREFGPEGIALRYVDGGDYDQAMSWFERGVEVRDPTMPNIGFPHYDPIRSHPRFPDLLRSMNFPDSVIAQYLAGFDY